MQFNNVVMTAEGASRVLLYFVFLSGRLTRAQTLAPLCQHTCVLPLRQESLIFGGSLVSISRNHFF